MYNVAEPCSIHEMLLGEGAGGVELCVSIMMVFLCRNRQNAARVGSMVNKIR